MSDELRPDELDLVGQWLDTGSRVVADSVAARIQWLVSERLEQVAVDGTGWETLFRDPSDGRLWERTYPHGGWHGGGPPRLTHLSREQAARKYQLPAV